MRHGHLPETTGAARQLWRGHDLGKRRRFPFLLRQLRQGSQPDRSDQRDWQSGRRRDRASDAEAARYAPDTASFHATDILAAPDGKPSAGPV